MAGEEPVAELEPQLSNDNATATPWAEASERLEQAEVFWLSTVRPDGRPHVTPVLSVWLHGALYFCTGERERKAKNLVRNAHCVLTTGCNAFKEEGIDLVVEGDAVRVHDEARLQHVASSFLLLSLSLMRMGCGALRPYKRHGRTLHQTLDSTLVCGVLLSPRP